MQIESPENMSEVTETVLVLASKKDHEGSVVLALTGELGAGKTTFVQHLASQLGVTEIVTSPTFVIMKGYECAANAPFSHLVHIDAYRIEDVDEMRVLGFSDLLKQKDTIICIEWPEQIPTLIPKDAIKIGIAIEGTNRTVTIS